MVLRNMSGEHNDIQSALIVTHSMVNYSNCAIPGVFSAMRKKCAICDNALEYSDVKLNVPSMGPIVLLLLVYLQR